MGHHVSKALSILKRQDSGTDKDDKNRLEDPPGPPPTDPRLPLTARQLFNITKSWKGISRAMEPTGINMFVKLFEDNEDILHLFQASQYKRIHEFHRDSLELAQHASIVMSNLDESIKTLSNVDRFTDHLHAIGRLHRRIPGFQKDYFWRIETPFLTAVQETLGERYTENMENIYKVTICFILSTVAHGFDLGERTVDELNSSEQELQPDPEPNLQQNDVSTLQTPVDISPTQTKDDMPSILTT